MTKIYLIESIILHYKVCFLSALYYMLHLSNELIQHIYSFDPTYHNIYKICINELKQKWKTEYNDYVLWRAHCC